MPGTRKLGRTTDHRTAMLRAMVTFLLENGKIETKGKYVKENSPLDNNLPILNEALVAFITKGIPVEETINTNAKSALAKPEHHNEVEENVYHTGG